MSTQRIENIASVCHEANRAWCEANGDYSQVSWAEAEDWQRESAMKGVEFRLNNPNTSSAAQHDAWMADKIKDGWTFGAKKDAEAKTHPSLVPYAQLSHVEQAKDRLFRAIVDQLGRV